MQRVLTSRGGVLLYLTVWLLLGLGLGGAISTLGDEPLLRAMLIAVPVTLLFSVGAGFSAYYMCKANPLRERSPAVILVSMLTAAVCAGFLWVFLMRLWNIGAESFGAEGIAIRPQLTALLFSLGILMYGLLATLKATRPTEWSSSDNQVTPAEGGEFNARLCGEYNQSNSDNSKGVHNPFLCEALLIATIDYVKLTYGLPAASAEVEAAIHSPIGGAFASSMRIARTPPGK